MSDYDLAEIELRIAAFKEAGESLPTINHDAKQERRMGMSRYWVSGMPIYSAEMENAIEEGDQSYTPKQILERACEIGDLELTYTEAKRLLQTIGDCIDNGYMDFYFYHDGHQFHFYKGDVS